MALLPSSLSPPVRARDLLVHTFPIFRNSEKFVSWTDVREESNNKQFVLFPSLFFPSDLSRRLLMIFQRVVTVKHMTIAITLYKPDFCVTVQSLRGESCFFDSPVHVCAFAQQKRLACGVSGGDGTRTLVLLARGLYFLLPPSLSFRNGGNDNSSANDERGRQEKKQASQQKTLKSRGHLPLFSCEIWNANGNGESCVAVNRAPLPFWLIASPGPAICKELTFASSRDSVAIALVWARATRGG